MDKIYNDVNNNDNAPNQEEENNDEGLVEGDNEANPDN